MKARFLLVHTALLLLSTVFATSCFAQSCIFCRRDFRTCDSNVGSGDCRSCFCVLSPTTSYSDSLHPGAFVAQDHGRLIVSAVLPGSPADAAGVLPGDEVIQINGKEPSSGNCGEYTWKKNASEKVTDISLRRGGRQWETSIPLVSMGQLIEEAWSSGLSKFENVNVTLTRPHDTQIESYQYGFRWTKGEAFPRITAVLAGSPADRSGLVPGEEIVGVNGLKNVSDIPAGGELPDVLELRIMNLHGAERIVSLKSEGVSRLLRGFAESNSKDERREQSIASMASH